MKKNKDRKRNPDVNELLNRHRDKLGDILHEILEEELGEDLPFEEYERKVMEIMNEIARRELERKLKSMADGYPNKVQIDHNNDWHGIREETAFDYAQHQPGTVTYHSLVGGLHVHRFTYRECYRNGVTYVPLELDAGLMEHMTPGLAKCVALGFADMPMRRFEKLLTAAGRIPPSRSTLDRSARDLGAYAMAANEEIEPQIRAQEVVPTAAKRIVLGLDRTAVPMRPSDTARGAQYVCRDMRRSRPKQDLSIVKGAVQWKMDYVGTVCLVDGTGQRLVSRQYRLPSDVTPEPIIARMLADVRHVLGQRPDIGVVVVQDGAPELWKSLGNALRSESAVRSWEEVLDWYHLDERLSKCLDLCVDDGKARAAQRSRWHKQLLEKGGGVGRILSSLKRHAQKLDPEKAEPLREHIRYLGKQTSRTDYAEYKRRGLPIGSGVTEGACKSLVSVRAKRSGQRWSQRGLTAALHLRCIQQSDRFDGFWRAFSNRYRATSMEAI